MIHFENRILIDKNQPTPLAKIKDKNKFAYRIEVYGRIQDEFPGTLASLRLEFSKGGKPVDYLHFRRAGAMLVILEPEIANFKLDYDSCSIKDYLGEILPKEDVWLFYSPPSTA